MIDGSVTKKASPKAAGYVKSGFLIYLLLSCLSVGFIFLYINLQIPIGQFPVAFKQKDAPSYQNNTWESTLSPERGDLTVLVLQDYGRLDTEQLCSQVISALCKNQNQIYSIDSPKKDFLRFDCRNHSQDLKCWRQSMDDHKQFIKTCFIDYIVGLKLCPKIFLLTSEVDLNLSRGDRQENDTNSMLYILGWTSTLKKEVKIVDFDPVRSSKESEVQNQIMYTIMLYLSNCAQNENYSTALKFFNQSIYNLLIDISTLQRHVTNKIQNKPRPAVDVETLLFNKTNLCSIPPDIISLLQVMASHSSLVPSLGTQLKAHMKSLSQSNPLTAGLQYSLYEDIDGRVSTLVMEWEHSCQKSPDWDIFTDLHKKYRDTPAKYLTFLPSGAYLIIRLKNGLTGYMKYLGIEAERPTYLKYFNQGPAELVAHYIDRYLGLGVTPLVVRRRLAVNVKCPHKSAHGENCLNLQPAVEFPLLDRSKMSHPIYGGLDKFEYRVQKMKNQTRFDPKTKSYYIEFALVGQVKSFTYSTYSSLVTYMNSHKPQFMQYFIHQLNLSDMEQSGISRQHLADISDIILFDFIIHNTDRRYRKNWVMSEGRLIAFDNGLSFWVHDYKICARLLYCPPYLCNEVALGVKGCLQELSSKKRFCRFTRHAKRQLERVNPDVENGSTLGSLVKAQLKKEPWFEDYGEYFRGGKMEVGLDARVKFAIDHINKCESMYKDEIFI